MVSFKNSAISNIEQSAHDKEINKMSTFSALKNKRKTSFAALRNKIENEKASKGGGNDDRYWKADQDKSGNGYAIIRFLPATDADVQIAGDNAAPYVTYFRHMFKSPSGKWFVNNCPTTHNEECPVCEANGELWNTELPDNQAIARKRKRQAKYVANILVIKDSKNPANEGKVFLYEFGTKIFEKIEGAMFPEFEDEVAYDPTDFWEGANFKLKIRKVEGYTNYDKSEFDDQSQIAKTDGEIEEIWNKQHPLLEIVDKSKFKSYDNLKKELDRALGNTTTSANKPQDDTGSTDGGVVQPIPSDNPSDSDSNDADVDDKNADYFKSILNED